VHFGFRGVVTMPSIRSTDNRKLARPLPLCDVAFMACGFVRELGQMGAHSVTAIHRGGGHDHGLQKGRVKEVLHQLLNQPTAVARLRAALVADGIPFTDGELAFVAASLFPPSIAP
jgi:hypothetical protein